MLQTNEPIRMNKLVLILLIFIVSITMLRLVWMNMYQVPEKALVENGKVDLSAWDFSNDETISLEGEWGFFPNEFIDPMKTHPNRYIVSTTDEKQEFYSGHNIANEGFASYQLEITTPKERQQFGIRFSEIQTAAKVFVNGQLIAENGHPAKSPIEHKGELGALTTFFHHQEDKINIIIHVSDHDLPLSPFLDEITFGSNQAIQSEVTFYDALQLIVCIILLLHSFYAFSLYMFGIKRKQLLYFGLLVLITTLSTAIDDGRILSYWISLPPVWTIKMLYITFFLAALFSLIFVNSIHTFHTKVYYTLIYMYIILSIVMIVSPIVITTYLLPIGLLLNIFTYTYIFVYFLANIKNTSFDRLFILLSMLAICSNIFWGTGVNLHLIDIVYYPFDLVISITSFSFYLFMHYNQLSKQNEEWAQELLEIDKKRDEFLANTSHEIRNPLHGIINIAQTLLDRKDFSEESKENLTLLIDVAKRMSYTLNDLSAVTQLREGQVKLHKSKVDLHTIASLVINMLDFMKEGKNISLTSNIRANFPNVFADKNRLIQILFNLVHNAIKFTEEGSIVITANYSGTMATIYVKDTGIGIPSSQNMEKLFQAYEQNAHQEAVTSGIGIGLHVSKQLVELHGGNIAYRSTNEGTTFIFTIPLASKEQSVVREAEPLKSYEEIATTVTNTLFDNHMLAASDQASILIVDDDPVNVKVIRQMLSNDYHILTALSAKEALQKLEKNRFELIISDVMMPYMSGYELTRKIREQYTISELPILLITARNLPEDIHTAFESGANDYLIKPVNALELKTRVKALTELKQSVKELLRLEAAWLQAQIHPHFLFNTLNSIAALAEIDNDRMVALLEAFGNYLQKSFSILNVESEISIVDELALTRSYVHIEKERFGDRVQVLFDIDENMEVNIPPLAIQPLVENAIMHGILGKTEGGTVKVSVKKYNDYVHVVIEDNGVGMKQEKVDELLDLHYTVHDGVGVKNTNRRLTQLHGKGLQIKSKIGVGTTISFQIPNEP